MPTSGKVVIIGAGIGGLAAANILAQAGYEVSVYEKNAGPGGRMGKLEIDGFTFDTGPSWYLMKDVFEQYFELFGKKTSDYFKVERLDPAYKVVFDTRDPVVITGDLEENIRTFETIEPGAGEALKEYIESGELNYKSALRYFLYNNFTRPHKLARKDIIRSLPSFLPVLTSSLHGYIAKRFKTQELQQILEYPSVFLGGSPFAVPALYQLMSYLDFKEGVFYPQSGGMYRIIESLMEIGNELGVTYHFNSDVTGISTTGGIATGITIGNEGVAADIVISNADLHHTEMKLLRPEDRSYPATYWNKRTAGPSALLMYLGVKGSLPELEHHTLFFVNAWQKNFDDIYKDKVWPDNPSLYVSKTTATDRSTAPDGHENIFVLVPLPPGVSHDKETTEFYTEKYLEQLEQSSGIHDLRSRIVVKVIRTPQYFSETFNAWQNTALGMSHTLRQSAFFRPSVKSKKIDSLYYVGGGTQPGIGVPMCIISAQLVYKRIANDDSPYRPDSIRRLV